MAKKPKANASTQEHLDIDDIVDDLVLLKTGWVALVMSTTAVNFDLLSEAEQDATIYAFGAFLNSLSFPLEILIRSKKADITSYFQSLEDAEAAQPNPDLKRQIQKYKDFIQSTVQQKTVLDKKFYLIINFSPLELGLKGLGGKKQSSPKSKSQRVTDAKTALMPKRDHIIKQTARLGLTTRQLNTQELIELFYDIYNPAPTGTQRVLLDTAAYTAPLVEPAVEVPTPAPIGPSGSQAIGQSGINQSVPDNLITQQPDNPTIPSPQAPGLDLRPAPSQFPLPSPTPAPPQAPELATALNQSPITSIPGNPPSSGFDPREQTQLPNNPITQQPTEELRPVAPRQPEQNPNIAPHHADALKNLQEATARAAQITNRPLANTQTTQPASPAGGQPDNLIAQKPNV